MWIILSVVALVALISLYDHFSARRWQEVTSDERNEAVFAHRNREYGAYQMRKSYNVQLMLIVGVMIFTIGSAYGVYLIVREAGKELPAPPPDVLAQLTMDAPEIDEPLDPPVEEEIPAVEQTVQFLPPVVTDNADEADEVPVNDNQVNMGEQNQEGQGEGPGGDAPPPPPPPPPPNNDDDKVHTFVEESAEFPGGPAALKKFLSENINYPQSAIELGLEGKCYLQFVVSKQGSISNVEVKRGVTDCPECDKEAERVVRSMPKWKPGKNDGKAVNSTFNLPVSFKLN
ncbi:MAG: TonB family protein [Fluviicola sp.]|nr:TonB family protein [Fluviicola sp.]